MGLAIRGVAKRYGDTIAVRDLSLDIGDGEFVTLLGPSGCGKTTTLMLLAGFAAPDEGEISLDGRVLSAAGRVVPPERRSMAMVFQSYANWPHMTVRENVVYGLRLRRVQRREIDRRFDDVVRLVELHGMDRRYPSELSGGQQQRVALARALIVEPRVLLLDEPLSNLDTRLRGRMRDELRRLQRETGITFVYVTHDQGEALAMSDQVVVMQHGSVHQIGSPRDVYTRPRTPFVARFIGAYNMLPARIVGRPRSDTIEAALPDGTRVICAAAPPTDDSAGILIGVRPDRIRLSGQPGPGAFALDVNDVVYLGSQREFSLRLADHVLKVIETEVLDAHQDPPPRLWGTVDPEDWRVFADDGTLGATAQQSIEEDEI